MIKWLKEDFNSEITTDRIYSLCCNDCRGRIETLKEDCGYKEIERLQRLTDKMGW